MTQMERDALIDRYLSSRMSPAEEQNFFIQAAVDKELRLELKARQTIESAIRKDSILPAEDHLAVQTHVAAMLGAGASKLPTGTSKELSSISNSSNAIPRIGKLLFSGLVLATLVALIAIWSTGGEPTAIRSRGGVMGSSRDTAIWESGKRMAPATVMAPDSTDSVKSHQVTSPLPALNSERKAPILTERGGRRRGATKPVRQERQSETIVAPQQKRPASGSVSVEGTVTVHVPK